MKSCGRGRRERRVGDLPRSFLKKRLSFLASSTLTSASLPFVLLESPLFPCLVLLLSHPFSSSHDQERGLLFLLRTGPSSFVLWALILPCRSAPLSWARCSSLPPVFLLLTVSSPFSSSSFSSSSSSSSSSLSFTPSFTALSRDGALVQSAARAARGLPRCRGGGACCGRCAGVVAGAVARRCAARPRLGRRPRRLDARRHRRRPRAPPPRAPRGQGQVRRLVPGNPSECNEDRDVEDVDGDRGRAG